METKFQTNNLRNDPLLTKMTRKTTITLHVENKHLESSIKSHRSDELIYQYIAVYFYITSYTKKSTRPLVLNYNNLSIMSFCICLKAIGIGRR